jgi:hypothetical protein
MNEPTPNPETRIALCWNTEGPFRLIQSIPSQYAEFKRLKRENLRDRMTNLELIFSMLGEAATTEITRTRDAQGFPGGQTRRAPTSRQAGLQERQVHRRRSGTCC